MVARALIELISTPVRPLLGTNAAIVAACHDLGKVSPGYQLKYFRDAVRTQLPDLAKHALGNYETKHAMIGENAFNAAFGTKRSSAGMAVGAHHGLRDDPGLPHDAGVYGGPDWACQRLALAEELVKDFGTLVEDHDLDRLVLAGMVCIADWIGSDERFFGSPECRSGLQEIKLAQEAVSACGWRNVEFVQGLSFEEIFGFRPNCIQSDFIDSVRDPGLYILEAPMGIGKTEAALYAAYRLITSGVNSGLYFGLPTRLTSDKIHERVKVFLERVGGENTSVRLAHGQAWLHEYESGGRALAPGEEWFNPSKRALLMPFAVGTIDQALMAVIKVKHFFVRCFGLSGKVVVLDEVHSYDVYTGTLLDALINRLLEMKCTVIVLSATLTGARKAALLNEKLQSAATNDYPLITFQNQERFIARPTQTHISNEISIKVCDINDLEVAEQATEKATAGQCVICIANTVAKAQSWYNNIKATMPQGAFEVGLLHSRFPSFRRHELEELWTKALGKHGPRPSGCVLVATQVVEQSVDLDADFMITELAPTDMLLQRIGRLWRHSRSSRPCSQASLLVVARDLESVETLDELKGALGKTNAKVYAPYVLWRSFQAWKHLKILHVPRDIRRILEMTYSDPQDDLPSYAQEAREALLRRRTKLRELAVAARSDAVGFPTMEDREGAATRYSDFFTIDVVLVKSLKSTGYTASLLLENRERARVDNNIWVPSTAVSLHRNLVPVGNARLLTQGNV